MMTTHHNDSHSKLDLKRKRRPDLQCDEYEMDHDRSTKRANLARLPIRLTPASPQDSQWHNHTSAFAHPLTPVDSSDEEATGQAEDPWGREHTRIHPHRNSTYSLASITVNIDPAEDEDTDMATSPRIPTAQSTSAPSCDRSTSGRPKFLIAPPISLDERVPTPITDKFNLFDAPHNTRTWRTCRPTILSPVTAEEHSFPSPIESLSSVMNPGPDPETIMRMEHTSTGFGALSVTCNDDTMMQDATPQSEPPSAFFQPAPSAAAKNPRQSLGRNAKLHMGFRSDCEKCLQRVPGHYSHIIWS